jgi:hypothetical protein
MASKPLNTGTSIVDYLKSTGQKSDYESRSVLATKYGIKNYTGSAEQNTQLLGFVNKPTTPPRNTDEATDRINQNQQKDFESKTKNEEPSTRTSSKTYNDIFNEIKTSLTSGLPTKPETISLAKTFTDLRSSKGVSDLEDSLNDLQTQARDIQAISRARTTAERGKAVPMNVISGRVSEAEQQENERLQVVNDSIKTISAQLDTKYKMIDSIMQYTGTDYANAVDAYDKQFSQNLSLLTMARGIAEDEKTKEEQTADNARANLQIIYNNLSSGGVDPTSIDDGQKANITKLELQAGLPIGFYANVVNKNPKADILSTTTREDNGKKYSDIVLRDKNGKITTQSVYLGGSQNESSGKMTEGEIKLQDREKIKGDLEYYKGGDGRWNPEDILKVRDSIAVNSPENLTWFDNAYPPSKMLNENHKENSTYLANGSWKKNNNW